MVDLSKQIYTHKKCIIKANQGDPNNYPFSALSFVKLKTK